MVFELKVLRIHKKNEVVDWVGAISSGWLKLPCQGEVRNDDMAISFLGPSSLSASDFALRAAPGQVAVEVFILNCVSNEDWSGRDLSAGCVAGDLNAPEAHKPPWRVALPAFGELRLRLNIIEPYPV
ncbi:hypothetical protein JY97_15630 [Alkalispirochaeta odontotermitis]|nr:hypothetical protein JY97_15630 [Alkalispirochaeta odontotermitis]CAB1084197.1 hypothetical protein D1AOALGA4SA_11724 [Olavius algarvensis Delta 1 endosymbiont]